MTMAYSQLMSRSVSKHPGRSIHLKWTLTAAPKKALRRVRQAIAKASRRHSRPRHTRRRGFGGRRNVFSCRSWR